MSYCRTAEHRRLRAELIQKVEALGEIDGAEVGRR